MSKMWCQIEKIINSKRTEKDSQITVKSIRQIAEELDIHLCTLYTWLCSYQFNPYRIYETNNFNANNEFYEVLNKYVQKRRSSTAKKVMTSIKKLQGLE